jgi:D-3-phosphoglycerate dehydrogenase
VLTAEAPESLSVKVSGELSSEDVGVLKLSALRGLFSTITDQQVTFVNAPALAAERGLEAELSTASESPNHRSLVDVRIVSPDGSAVNASGTLTGPQEVQKIVSINGRSFDLRAEGVNMILHYGDKPGALGRIGTILGEAGVNIEAAQMSQDTAGTGATVMLRLDRDVPADVRNAIRAGVDATTVEVVNFS